MALACARRHEAWMAHHERARAVAGELAEAFVVERALAELPTDEPRVDVAAFVRAGLEAASAEVAASATAAAWSAEIAWRNAERKRNQLALVRALGLPPASEARLDRRRRGGRPSRTRPPRPSSRRAPTCSGASPRSRRADHELRVAVRAQFPSLIVEPGLAFDPATGFGAVRLRVPTGMGGAVRAAEAGREAARADVESAVLDALRESGEARASWAPTSQRCRRLGGASSRRRRSCRARASASRWPRDRRSRRCSPRTRSWTLR